jgi:hypothetical protein
VQREEEEEEEEEEKEEKEKKKKRRRRCTVSRDGRSELPVKACGSDMNE